ncbi:MAG: hypothetical protein EOO23_05170 [Comamonadaceae bacterium]|nr:MAG: hypothetical protein EOO23_05170 [Comamonadaceae bacterium]
MSLPPLIEQIPLGSLKRYLGALGWRRRALPSGVELFSYPAGHDDQIEIVLPETSRSKDVLDRLQAAVATLMVFERRTVEQVVAAIRAISYDLVRSKLPDTSVRHDTVRLDTAGDVIRSLTRMLAASAHAELHEGPYFVRLDTTAQRYADECRFGHTFRGSFGFTIESPVGPNSPEIDGSPTPVPPLSRRAVSRLARGLRIVEGAIDREQPGEIVGSYQIGLNANAVEELLNMVEAPQVGEVNFEIVFSPEWGIPPDLGPAPDVAIRQARGVDILREAAKRLRIVHYERQRTIVGYVRTLHSLENPSDLLTISGTQDVIVEWETEEFGRRNIRVALGPEEYLRAIEAHGSGRQVSVFGELVQGGRQWRLENPVDFVVL